MALGLNSRNAGLCILPRDLPGHLGATAAGTATSSRRPVLPASHPNRGEGKRGPEVLVTGPAGHGGVGVGAAGSTAPVLSLQPELESTAVPPEGRAPKPNTDGTAGVTAWAPSLGSDEALSFWLGGWGEVHTHVQGPTCCGDKREVTQLHTALGLNTQRASKQAGQGDPTPGQLQSCWSPPTGQ